VTGPEHYREAERLLNLVPTHGLHPETGLTRSETFSTAHTHALLAIAAATAAEQATAYDGDEQSNRSRGWAGVV
jgi:hypothetical protein